MSFKINIKEFNAGDSVQASITSEEYKSETYNLVLVLINAKNSYQLDCVSGNSGWDLNLKSDITKDIEVGLYRIYYIISDNDSFVRQIEGDKLEVKVNIIEAKIYDDRTEMQKRLATIKDLIDGRLIDGVNNFTVNGRSVTLMSITDLQKLEEEYEFKVSSELGLIDKKEKGRTNRNILRIRYKGLSV